MQSRQRLPLRFAGTALLVALMSVSVVGADQALSEPKVINPGPPPSDAVVLFDGTDLSSWRSAKGGEAQWKIEAGAMVVNGTGNLVSREEFGSCQLHLEWAAPPRTENDGQGRGNSGVYFQGRYEIQILDSYENKTYPDGQAGSFYGHYAPLVNACLQPGEWQTYDIIFHRPQQDATGEVIPGSLTVLHNGVLIQDHVPVSGKATTAAMFQGIAEEGPLVLQDHGNPVRYRNVWIRSLE